MEQGLATPILFSATPIRQLNMEASLNSYFGTLTPNKV
jgi:hypothetical protein